MDILLELATKWSADRGWTDVFYLERHQLAAFPPNGAMPLPLPQGVREDLLDAIRQIDPCLESYYFLRNFSSDKKMLAIYSFLVLTATYGLYGLWQADKWHFGYPALALAVVALWSDLGNRCLNWAIARVRYRRLHHQLKRLGYL